MAATKDLRVKIFADGADLDGIEALTSNPLIKGITTNPTLMRKAGVTDYAEFAAQVLRAVPNLPVSFEVFADDLGEMEWQACEIASWGRNVNVKIPITNTRGESAGPLIRRLSAAGVTLNITAILTLDQVRVVADALNPAAGAIVSVFAGRIADAGHDPAPVMKEAVSILKSRPKAELLWASTRELLNIVQADQCGCHIVTVPHDLLGKMGTLGKDLTAFSLDTVKMFREDALKAGYAIKARVAAAD